VTKKQRRKAIKKQLQYINRNLGQIEQLQLSGASLELLSDREHKMLLVVGTVYQQQLSMSEKKQQRIDDRIVSLTQPHIRPIVRGKAGTPVEFGAKLSVSYHNGYVFIDRLSWDNFNESGDLKLQAEKFKVVTGNYPESIHVDQIYRTKENRAWCRERGIRITGVPLGRQPKIIDKEKKKQSQDDEKFRSRIEGKLRMKSRRGFLGVRFTKHGEAKRRFSLDRVMTKLSETSQTAIAITFLVMNLSALLRQFFALFYIYLRINAVFAIFEFR
jgi:transposase, IS5 family